MSARALHDLIQTVLMSGLAQSAVHRTEELADPDDPAAGSDIFSGVDLDAEGVGDIPEPERLYLYNEIDHAAVAQAFVTALKALGGDEAVTLVSKSAEENASKFVEGLTEGILDGAIDDLADIWHWACAVVGVALKRGGTLLTDAVALTYSPPAWAAGLRAIGAAPGSPEFRQAVENFGAAIPPDLNGTLRFLAGSGTYIDILEVVSKEIWNDFRVRQDIMMAGSLVAGTIVGEKSSQIVAAGSDAKKHGTIIGHPIGMAFSFSVVTIVAGVFRIPLRITEKIAAIEDILEWNKRVVASAALIAKIRKRLKRLSKLYEQLLSIGAPLNKGAKLLETEARKLLEFSHVVLPYRQLAQIKRNFNSVVRLLYGTAQERISWLTAHHIILDTYFDRFKSDWRRVGWRTERDMAAILVHSDGHYGFPTAEAIGRGDFAPPSDIQARPNHGTATSLTDLTTHLAKREKTRPFRNVLELIEAHEDWYIERFSIVGKSGRRTWPEQYRKILKPILDELRRVRKELGYPTRLPPYPW